MFKALADRHRVRILNRLLQAGGEAVCVCDFEAMLGLKQPTVSYHLKQLLDAGLVRREKRGSFAYFSLVPGGASSASARCSTCRRSPPDRRASISVHQSGRLPCGIVMGDRVAVITDIHANLPSLRAALARIDELGIETVYCGGSVRLASARLQAREY